MKFFKYLVAFLFLLSLVSFAPGCTGSAEDEAPEVDDPLEETEELGEEDEATSDEETTEEDTSGGDDDTDAP